jgi:hypothetical protein
LLDAMAEEIYLIFGVQTVHCDPTGMFCRKYLATTARTMAELLRSSQRAIGSFHMPREEACCADRTLRDADHAENNRREVGIL